MGRRYLVLSLHSLRLGQRGVDAQGLQGMTEPSGRRDNARLWGQGRSLEEALWGSEKCPRCGAVAILDRAHTGLGQGRSHKEAGPQQSLKGLCSWPSCCCATTQYQSAPWRTPASSVVPSVTQIPVQSFFFRDGEGRGKLPPQEDRKSSLTAYFCQLILARRKGSCLLQLQAGSGQPHSQGLPQQRPSSSHRMLQSSFPSPHLLFHTHPPGQIPPHVHTSPLPAPTPPQQGLQASPPSASDERQGSSSSDTDLCNHVGDVAGVGWQQDRVGVFGKLGEGVHVLLGHREGGSRATVLWRDGRGSA